MPPFQLIIDPYSRKLDVNEGSLLLDAIMELNLEINASCGGLGSCGKCLIQNLSTINSLSKLTEKEKKILSSEQIAQGYRLACQTRAMGDSYIRLTEKILGKAYKKAQIMITQNDSLIKEPIVKRSKSSLSKTEMELETEYGLAFDLGTTTIVGYLVNLRSGKILATDSMFNPQITIGEDVISRIAFADKSKENTAKIQNLVINAFNQIITNLVRQEDIAPKQISEFVLVGNTAMHHLFFGLPVGALGRSPYLPAIKEALYKTSDEIFFERLELSSRLRLGEETMIYSPPIIAGFVGGDTVADIIAVRQDKYPTNVLVVDIGTNGEMTLGDEKNGIIAASVAAGPAFEGAQITFGMRGETGAIERIVIDPLTLIPEIEVIGNTSPIGLCGSAIIDIVAEMLRSKIIARSGNFNKKFRENSKYPRIRKGKKGFEYIIHSSDLPAKFNFTIDDSRDSSSRKNIEIFITQGDIREIQKAKGAFLSGALVLLDEKSQTTADLDQILIAGAFGAYLHKENAKFIGLIPEIPLERIHQLGNAAGAGAVRLLLNDDLKREADKIAQDVKYIELANSPKFPRVFAESMIFPHRNLDLFPSLKSEYKDLPYR
ncbi:MAG: ASKHA domain-containing protein [Promethearchaeota archaeon]